MRKGLLGDLSTLVQIAKSLQETISEPFAGEVIHFLLDDVMAKAFKVVTRAVGFVDMWSTETNEGKVVLGSPSILRDQVNPAIDARRLTIDTKASRDIELRNPVDSAKFLPSAAGRHGSKQSTAGADVEARNGYAEQPPLTSAFRLRKGSAEHRLSATKTERPPHSTLATEQLARVHDLCISHIGAFIGHHLHARSSSELVGTTDRLLKACKDLLAIVDEVYSHDPQRSSPVQQARIDFQLRLDELAKATKDVFKFSEIEDGQLIMMPDQSNRLVTVGTSLIRTAGECVARTQCLIKQVGDFELDNRPTSANSSKQLSDDGSRTSMSCDRADNPGRVLTSFEKRSLRKMLPPPPPFHQRVSDVTEASDFALASPTVASDATTLAIPHTAGLHRSLPLGPQRRSAVRLSQATSFNAGQLRQRHSTETDPVSPARKDSVGISITGSVDTYRSSTRDSGISAISEVSTRATTPDKMKEPMSPDPALLNSFNSLSSMRSSNAEAEIETETKLLQQTYASELMLNKDGHISGGSLPALVERLTIHDTTPDPQFVAAFFITFRMFTTAREFAQALITRFDYVGDSKGLGTPVRLRIYNVFKGWIETYWNAEADKDALGDIRYFALHKLRAHIPSAGERLVDLTRKVAASYHAGTMSGPLVSGIGKTSLSISSALQTGSTPEPVVNRKQLNALRAATSGGSQCNVLDFDPLELARQLTLITSAIFCEIQADELLSLEWNKKGNRHAHNIRNMSTLNTCLLYTSPSPRDGLLSRMPSSA